MSAPIITGTVALILGAKPDLTPSQVQTLITANADLFNIPVQSSGRVNIANIFRQ